MSTWSVGVWLRPGDLPLSFAVRGQRAWAADWAPGRQSCWMCCVPPAECPVYGCCSGASFADSGILRVSWAFGLLTRCTEGTTLVRAGFL
jgi:hypothetical protein